MTTATVTRDKQGRVLSRREADGTGYDYTYDERGNALSCRHADGTEWHCTYDERNYALSFRHTDGTGWDCTRDERGRELSCRYIDGTGYEVIAHDTTYTLCRNLDGTYSAGCRQNLTLEQARKHWGAPRTDARAVLFTAALAKEAA